MVSGFGIAGLIDHSDLDASETRIVLRPGTQGTGAWTAADEMDLDRALLDPRTRLPSVMATMWIEHYVSRALGVAAGIEKEVPRQRGRIRCWQMRVAV